MAAPKRVTIPVDQAIDSIKEKIRQDTGIEMSYSQVFNFLIHFYIKHANEPRTQWRSLK